MKKTLLLLNIFLFSIGVNIALAQVPAYVPTNGLVGWWPFNGNANDESGNGNNGTVNGATLTTDRFGNANKAYSFDGVDDFIDVPVQQNGVTAYTISCWFKYPTSANSWEYKALVQASGTYPSAQYSFTLQLSASPLFPGQAIHKASCSINGPGVYNGWISNNTYNDDTWHHLVGVLSVTAGSQTNSANILMYMDGVLINSNSFSADYSSITAPINGLENTKIGMLGHVTPSRFFDGSIDDIAIYNRALTQQEITNLYTSSEPLSCLPDYVPTNGLVGYWPFCGNANDESGNGNNGTVNGATLTTDRFGNANKAYSFDRNTINDIIIANSPSLNSLTSITMSLWVNLNSYGAPGQGGYNHYINKSDQSNNHHFVYANNSNQLYFYYSGGSSGLVTNNLPTLNQWNHLTLVYTYDGSIQNSYCKFYLNGSVIDSMQTTTLLNATNHDIRIGAFGNESYNRVDGKIDDIAIYNRALTQQEITNLYTNSVPPTCNIAPASATVCAGDSVTLTASTSATNVSICSGSELPGTLQNGLVGYWPFCGNANDASGNGNNGTVNGATLTTDRFGNANSAYSFDGVDDYVNAGNNTIFNPGDFTISLWYYEVTMPSIASAHTMISKSTSNNNEIGYRIEVEPDGMEYFVLSQIGIIQSGTGHVANSSANLNSWTSILVRRSGGIVQLYKNGVQVGINSSLYAQITNNSNLLFGAVTDQNIIGKFFNGKLDDIAIWNRALTPSEIQQLYTQGQTTYAWSNGATTPSITVEPSTTTTYTCTATVNGASGSSTSTVTVNPLPTVNAGNDQVVCAGNTATLVASGAVSYSWDNNVPNGVAFTPSTTETYTVVGTDANGCTNTDEVVVTVNPLPTVNPSPEQFVCTNNFTLPIIFSGNTPGTVFNWVNNNATIGLASSGTGNIPSFLAVNTAPVPLTAMITVTPVYTNNGVTCSGNSLPFFITINPGGYVQSISNVTACNGNTVNAISFGGSMNTTYSWVNSNVSIGLPASGNGMIPSFIAQNTGSTASVATITVSPVTTFSGLSCFSEPSTFTITVNPTPQVSAGPDQTVCAGTPVILSGSGASAYFWNNSVSNGVAFSPAASNTYTVTGTDANGCVNSDDVVVTVNPLPTVNAGSDQSVCAGTSVTLSATGANIYAWDNNVSNGTAFTPTATTTYSVSGMDANGCSNTDQVLVTVNPLPNVNAGTDQTICNGDPVTLAGTGASMYAWNNNVTNGVAFNPMATATYSVAGTDTNGCSSSDEVVVIVNEATASTLTESALDSYTLNGQTYTQSGTYTQVLTNAAGCDSTITLNLTLSFTGLNELAQGIQLFPNPANDVLNIQSSAALVGEYTLYDAAGRAVLRGTFTGALTKIDVRNIAPGTYTLQAAELMERVVVLRK